ncbi:MAG: Hpt domain-containing protein, partial [Methylobacterium sp.]
MGGDIIETFLNEARDLLEQLEAALLDLEKRPNDRELVNTTFRALHTLKGSGGMFGPPAMAAFAHELENAFEKVRQDHAPVTPALVSLLLQSADQIRKLLFEADGDHSAESARLAKALIAEVDGAPAAAGSAPVAAAPAQPAAAASPLSRRFRIALRLERSALAFGTNPLALLDELRDLGSLTVSADVSQLPPIEDLVPTDLHLGWTILLDTAAPRSAIDDVFIFVDGPDAVVIEEIEADEPAVSAPAPVAAAPVAAAPVAAAPAAPTAAAPAPAPATAAPKASSAKAETPKGEAGEAKGQDARAEAHVRVSASRLDMLLDQVGELVIAQARLSALARNRHDPVLTTVAEEIERLSADLRDSAMGMRMVPIEQLFG